jgi:LysM repeat protein
MTPVNVPQRLVEYKHMFDEPLAPNTRSCLAVSVANIRSSMEVPVSALAHQLPSRSGQHDPSARRHLRLVPPISHERLARRQMYRRRRLVTAVVAVAVVLLVAPVIENGVSWAWHRAAGAVPASTATASQQPAPAATSWTVRPGDTLWGIARAVQPQGDIRPLVDRLSAAYKDRALQVGETIAVPAA